MGFKYPTKRLEEIKACVDHSTEIPSTIMIEHFFPDSEVSIVHQNGSQLSKPSKGVQILLHTREDENVPCCAELISGDHYAEIGLWFEGKELVDYDGVFSLPRELGEMLKQGGFVVAEEFFD